MLWSGRVRGEICKVGCTWDKQDITPRTQKIPCLISSSYSGNIPDLCYIVGHRRHLASLMINFS